MGKYILSEFTLEESVFNERRGEIIFDLGKKRISFLLNLVFI